MHRLVYGLFRRIRQFLGGQKSPVLVHVLCDSTLVVSARSKRHMLFDRSAIRESCVTTAAEWPCMNNSFTDAFGHEDNGSSSARND